MAGPSRTGVVGVKHRSTSPDRDSTSLVRERDGQKARRIAEDPSPGAPTIRGALYAAEAHDGSRLGVREGGSIPPGVDDSRLLSPGNATIACRNDETTMNLPFRTRAVFAHREACARTDERNRVYPVRPRCLRPSD